MSSDDTPNRRAAAMPASSPASTSYLPFSPAVTALPHSPSPPSVTAAPLSPARATALLLGSVPVTCASPAIAASYGRGLEAVAEAEGAGALGALQRASYTPLCPQDLAAVFAAGLDVGSDASPGLPGDNDSGITTPQKLLALARGTLDALNVAARGGDAVATTFIAEALRLGLLTHIIRDRRQAFAAAERDLCEDTVAEYERACQRQVVTITRPEKAGFFSPNYALPDGTELRSILTLFGPGSEAIRDSYFDALALEPAMSATFGLFADTYLPPGEAADHDRTRRALLGGRVVAASSCAYLATLVSVAQNITAGMKRTGYDQFVAAMAKFTLTPREWRGLFLTFGRYKIGVVTLMNLSTASYLGVPGPVMDAWFDPEVDGVARVLDALSSTSLDENTTEVLLISLAYAGDRSEKFGATLAQALVDKGAFTLLQPVILHGNPILAIRAAFIVCVIATTCESSAEPLQRSGVLDVMTDVLRALVVGKISMNGFLFLILPTIQRALQPEVLPALQLAALVRLSAGLGGFNSSMNVAAASSPATLSLLRACATSSDAFIYANAIFILKELGQPVPYFRHVRNSALEGFNAVSVLAPARAAMWSTEQVAAWVGHQDFRAYRSAFRDAFVSGRILFSLEESHLEDMGIARSVHRLAILAAIGDLREASDSPTVAGAAASAAALGLAAVAPETFDVFLSYRRAGGADFAQLLKIQLETHGLSVFLDTDNLGTGVFQEELVTCLRGARNVVLVWSRGCMDRFLDDRDAAQQDFVRMEYMQALRLGKHTVPVFKEDFEFPAAERLPADVRAVMSLNAVKWVGEYREASFQKLAGALQK